MTFIQGNSVDSIPKPIVDLMEATLGYVPNSALTMSLWPELLQAFGGISGTIMQSGELNQGLKPLIALISSVAAGCNYCQAHTSSTAVKMGIDAEKVKAVYEFQTSALFTEAERAALTLAWHASLQPNAIKPEDFETAKNHFSDREIVEIIAVASLFGFLNRWNDSFATTLESSPLETAKDLLSDQGWQQGKH